MPELPRKRQELYARFLADDHPQIVAYEMAGYIPSSANASTLANRPEIKARVAELREEKQQKRAEFEARILQLGGLPEDERFEKEAELIEWTADKVRAELFQNARLAQTAGEFGAAKECLKLIGESIGMWEKKPKSDKPEERAQVSLTFVNESLGRLEDASGRELAPAVSPLAPRIPDTRRNK